MVRLICLSVILACVATSAFGQTAETRTEIWPEVDVFLPLTPKIRLMFFATVTKVEETREDTEGQFGANVDFFVRKDWSLRVGYHHGFSPGDGSYSEHRIVLEQTFRKDLPLKILLADRNREELRFVNGDFSVRYRNRLTLEREFKILKFHVTPYVSGEVYYDSRFDTWNRNRWTGGVQIPLKKGFPVLNLVHPKRLLVLDLYFVRQNDSRSDPPRVRGFGVTFNIHL